MKHLLLFTLLSLASLTSSLAAEDSQLLPSSSNTEMAVASDNGQVAKPEKPLHIVLGGGATSGGDTLATFAYTDGSTDTLKAGSGLLFHAGLDYRLSDRASLQGTLGYHFDSTKYAKNGSATFSRIPLDLLAYYHVSDAFRIGGGPRMVFGSKLKGSGVVSGINSSFDNTIGVVIEGEYRVIPMLGIKIRHVTEKYRQSGSPTDFDGSHFGILVNFYL